MTKASHSAGFIKAQLTTMAAVSAGEDLHSASCSFVQAPTYFWEKILLSFQSPATRRCVLTGGKVGEHIQEWTVELQTTPMLPLEVLLNGAAGGQTAWQPQVFTSALGRSGNSPPKARVFSASLDGHTWAAELRSRKALLPMVPDFVSTGWVPAIGQVSVLQDQEHRSSSQLQGASNLEIGGFLTNKTWILLIPLPVFTAHCLSHRNS